MKYRFLKLSLSASMFMASTGLLFEPAAVFAQEQAFTEEPADTTDSTDAVNENEVIPEASDDGTPYRDGTDLVCGLSLDTKVNGTVTDTATFVPGSEQTEIQIGGTLDLKKIWSNYRIFKIGYLSKNTMEQFRSKSLSGSFVYNFKINPDVVTVNEDIICDPAAWQTAFEQGSGEQAAGFFSYMKCTAATYDASTGTISVTFTVDENGTKLVSVKTLEDNPTAKPNTIDAYSPEGGLIIKSENFRKDAVAVPGEADFSGQLDLNPWMALIFPLRFQAETEHQGLTLAVPPATVDFVVENGTWADGTTDIKSVIVPTEVVQLDGVWQAAGQLPQDQIPSGMKAAEGFNPESGTWTPALNTTEHGVVLTDPEAASLTYTYSYEPNVVVKNVPIYRVYNPNSGEHFYTEDENERDFLVKAGWDDENIGWTSPQASNYPVYRLYNPNSGDHHFTMNEKEKDILSTIGWTYEGVSWYSLPYGTGIKVYREYNPNAKLAGAHNFTTSAKENNFLISVGWLGEGVGWWAVE